MMDCAQVDALLPEYLSGRLDADRADAFEEHAAHCARCAPIVDAATRTGVTLPAELAPPDLVRRRVLEAIDARPRARAGLPRWAIPAVAAALVLIALNLGAPPRKSGQVPMRTPSSALAIERADAELKALDAAEAELSAALRTAPGDGDLQTALSRIVLQRKALEALIKEFES